MMVCSDAFCVCLRFVFCAGLSLVIYLALWMLICCFPLVMHWPGFLQGMRAATL